MQIARTHLQKMIVPSTKRAMSTATIRDRFEAAYAARKAQIDSRGGEAQ